MGGKLLGSASKIRPKIIHNDTTSVHGRYTYSTNTIHIKDFKEKYDHMSMFNLSMDKNYNIIDQDIYDMYYKEIINDLKNNGYPKYPESISEKFQYCQRIIKRLLI